MRLIDADSLNRKKKYCFQTKGGCFPKSEWFIKVKDLLSAPTVDAVQIVRCKDCKNNDKENKICSLTGVHFTNMDFCSFGEKKQEVE